MHAYRDTQRFHFLHSDTQIRNYFLFPRKQRALLPIFDLYKVITLISPLVKGI